MTVTGTRATGEQASQGCSAKAVSRPPSQAPSRTCIGQAAGRHERRRRHELRSRDAGGGRRVQRLAVVGCAVVVEATHVGQREALVPGVHQVPVLLVQLKALSSGFRARWCEQGSVGLPARRGGMGALLTISLHSTVCIQSMLQPVTWLRLGTCLAAIGQRAAKTPSLINAQLRAPHSIVSTQQPPQASPHKETALLNPAARHRMSSRSNFVLALSTLSLALSHTTSTPVLAVPHHLGKRDSIHSGVEASVVKKAALAVVCQLPHLRVRGRHARQAVQYKAPDSRHRLSTNGLQGKA